MKKIVLTLFSLILIFNKNNLKAYDTYKLINSTEYEISENFTITNEGDKLKDFSVNLNTLLDSESPYHKINNISVEKVQSSNLKNEPFLDNSKMSISELNNKDKIEFNRNTDVLESGIKYTSSLSQTKGDYSKFKEYERYLKPEDKIESGSEAIINKAKEIAGKEKNPYYIAKKIFEYVNMNIEYNENNSNKGALNTLVTKNGVCEDYADLFVALCRADGVPARVVYGYRIKPEEISYTFKDITKDAHAWAEFYLPEYGWIIVEPTFLYYVNDKKTVPEDQFANADEANHILISYYPTDSIKYDYKLQKGDLEKINIDAKVSIRRKVDLNALNSKQTIYSKNIKNMELKDKTYSRLAWNLKYNNNFDLIKASLYQEGTLVKDISITQNESGSYDLDFNDLSPSTKYTLKAAVLYKNKQSSIYEKIEQTLDYNINDFKIAVENKTNTSLFYKINHSSIPGDTIEIYDENNKLIKEIPFKNSVEDIIRNPSVFNKNIVRNIRIMNKKLNIESHMITLKDKLPAENIFKVLFLDINSIAEKIRL